MRSFSGLLVIVIVGGYFGFEIYNVKRMQYRMEPAYIFDEFAGAQAGTEQCGSPDTEEQRRFSRNFDYVRRQAIADAISTSTSADEAAAEALIEQRLAERREEVDALIGRVGCDHPDVRRLVKLHEIRARLNLR